MVGTNVRSIAAIHTRTPKLASLPSERATGSPAVQPFSALHCTVVELLELGYYGVVRTVLSQRQRRRQRPHGAVFACLACCVGWLLVAHCCEGGPMEFVLGRLKNLPNLRPPGKTCRYWRGWRALDANTQECRRWHSATRCSVDYGNAGANPKSPLVGRTTVDCEYRG